MPLSLGIDIARSRVPLAWHKTGGVPLLGFVVVTLAAFRLRDTPLWVPTLVTAGVHITAVVARVACGTRGREVPRAMTALGHVTAALGAFFLFVSLSLR